jgi:hypothetical protein
MDGGHVENAVAILGCLNAPAADVPRDRARATLRCIKLQGDDHRALRTEDRDISGEKMILDSWRRSEPESDAVGQLLHDIRPRRIALNLPGYRVARAQSRSGGRTAWNCSRGLW